MDRGDFPPPQSLLDLTCWDSARLTGDNVDRIIGSELSGGDSRRVGANGVRCGGPACGCGLSQMEKEKAVPPEALFSALCEDRESGEGMHTVFAQQYSPSTSRDEGPAFKPVAWLGEEKHGCGIGALEDAGVVSPLWSSKGDWSRLELEGGRSGGERQSSMLSFELASIKDGGCGLQHGLTLRRVSSSTPSVASWSLELSLSWSVRKLLMLSL